MQKKLSNLKNCIGVSIKYLSISTKVYYDIFLIGTVN